MVKKLSLRQKLDKAADACDTWLKKASSHLNLLRKALKLWDWLVAKVEGLLAKVKK